MVALWLGGVRLNLTELFWLVSCSLLTHHNSLTSLKALLFGYLNAVGAGGLIARLIEHRLQAWLPKTFIVLDIPKYAVSLQGPPWLVMKTNFQNEVSQMAAKRYFQLGFANRILQKRDVLLIFEAEFTEEVL